MSKVQVCNRALSKYLGAKSINSLDEETAEAEQCKLHYDDTLKGLLEYHPWTFANTRQVLAEKTNDRTKEWTYRYQLPANCLYLRWVNDPEVARYMIQQDLNPDSSREMSGDNIYSDVNGAVCEFTTLVEDVNLMPQLFKDALSAALAAAICMPITEDVSRQRNAEGAAQELLDIAAARDEALSNVSEYLSMPGYMQARGIT